MNTTNTDMVEYMRQALDERATPDSEAWKRFQDEVEECFPHFRDMVHAETLRCEEYRICMLLKAGIPLKGYGNSVGIQAKDSFDIPKTVAQENIPGGRKRKGVQGKAERGKRGR